MYIECQGIFEITLYVNGVGVSSNLNVDISDAVDEEPEVLCRQALQGPSWDHIVQPCKSREC